MSIRTNQRTRPLRFGDFVAEMYRVWGKRRARELVRLAVNARLVVFRGRQRFIVSED